MAKKLSTNIVIIGDGFAAYLPGVKALLTIDMKSKEIFSKPDAEPLPIQVNKNTVKIIPWGSNNNLPQQIIAKVNPSEVLSNGLYFNMYAGYGDGLLPCYYMYENGKKNVKPYECLGEDLLQQIAAHPERKEELQKRYDIWEKTWTSFQEFSENNDMNYYISETFIDINYYYLAFVEIILSLDYKILSLTSKETSFCRFEQANDKGVIENVVFSSKWSEERAPKEKDNQIIPLLDPRATIRDLKRRIGVAPREDGEKRKEKVYRYFIPIILPSPGKTYYPRTPWYSVFESGWYDINLNIPVLKKAILENQMTIKYHVELSVDYFERIFREEKITDLDKKKARVKTEFQNMNDFLSNAENSGKSVVSFVEYFPDFVKNYMKITPLENPMKGGEFIEDSEEASNIMHYALGVHPSIVGSSPGKNKTINGTEARELFLIKQSLMKPLRDYVLKPLYVVKAINEWDPALQFTIPNMQLTTLDTGKQTEKVVQ
jgi:hypothetical protein